MDSSAYFTNNSTAHESANLLTLLFRKLYGASTFGQPALLASTFSLCPVWYT